MLANTLPLENTATASKEIPLIIALVPSKSERLEFHEQCQRSSGYEVVTAEHSDELFRILANLPAGRTISSILIEASLQHIISSIRGIKRYEHTRIVIAGNSTFEVKKESLHHQRVSFMLKPFRPYQLEALRKS